MIFYKIAIGQSLGYLPYYHDHITATIPMQLPYYLNAQHRYDIVMGGKYVAGLLKDINSNSLYLGKNISTGKNTICIKGAVVREQEGPYILIPKFFVGLAYRLKIHEEGYLDFGMQIGASGVYYASPSQNTSFYLPDGNFGLGYVRRNFSIGAGVMQVYNNKKNNFKLTRHYCTMIGYKTYLNHLWSLNSWVWYMVYKKPTKGILKVGAQLVYEDDFELGFVLKNNFGFSAIMGVGVPFADKRLPLKLSMAYNTLLKRSNAVYIPNSFELILSAKIK